jgi:hypothetical protein
MGILHVRLDKKCNFLRITETRKDPGFQFHVLSSDRYCWVVVYLVAC